MGLPVAMLDGHGIHIRTRSFRRREFRRGVGEQPAYDVRATWAHVSSWWFASDKNDHGIVCIDVHDPASFIASCHGILGWRDLEANERTYGVLIVLQVTHINPTQYPAIISALWTYVGVGSAR